MSDQKKSNPFDVLKDAIEIMMPDFRHYYRMTKKAKVVGVYVAEGGKYYADVQPLRNDESVDPNEPVVPKVEIPIIWAGPKRGVVCPPVEGTFCDLSYYDGDPNYPHITNFRWHDMDAPEAKLDEFVIQLEPGVEIRIDHKKQVVTLTPANVSTQAGKNWTVIAGDNAEITAGKDATVTAGNTATVQAPKINLIGDQTSTGTAGGIGTAVERSHRKHEGSYTLKGPQNVTGQVTISGNVNVAGTVSATSFVGPTAGCKGCGG